MPKRHSSTQELVNIYPPWSRTRKDQSSVGYRLLNSFGAPIDHMERSLEKHKKNIYLTTANIDEIDVTYKVLLPKEFEFELDTEDPLETCFNAPATSGLHLGEWHTIELAPNNEVDEFWYYSVPNRFSISEVVSGVEDHLLTMMSEDTIATGIWRHHLADTAHNGGKLYIEATGGTQYVKINDQKQVERARVRLTGKTRKGTLEEEILVFAWDQKQQTQKEWEEITRVDLFEMEPGIQIDITSSDGNTGPYMDFFNTTFSVNRNKIDHFWDLEFLTGQPILSRIEYISDEWQQLILGFSSKETKERWELLDGTHLPVSGVDMAVQPFTDRAWVVTEDAKLYCYDLIPSMPSGLERLRGITPGADVAIEIEDPNVILGEDIEFIPWHARPLQELRSYKLYYTPPSGGNVLLSDVTLPEGTELKRSIESFVSFTPAERGTYVLTMEATMEDGSVQVYKTLANVSYKTPLAEFDLGSLVLDTVEAIEFDTDQQMWLKTINDDFYLVQPHTDLMLIDYENKIMYFHENYDEVAIDDS